MKKGRLDKFYPSFTGEERFRLHLEALYRDDEAELKRLLETCPRESYVMNEISFADRCKASKEIVGMLCLALAPLLARLKTIECFGEALLPIEELRQRGDCRLPRRPPGRCEACLEKRQGQRPAGVEKQKRELLEEALTIWTAFAHCFGEECRVEPEKLVKVWFEPMLSELEGLQHLSDTTELNPEMLKEVKAAFEKVWSEIAA